MNKRYDVTLDLRDNFVKRTNILYTSGDAETMPLYIHLEAGDMALEPPSGALATLNFVAGNVRWPRVAEFVDGAALLYELLPEDIAIPGIVTVSVTVTNGAEILTWQGFDYTVAGSLADGQTEPPDVYGSWVSDMTERVAELSAKMEDMGGVMIPMSGFVTMKVGNDGVLYAVTAEGDDAAFEYDEDTGELYFVIGDDADG